MTANTSFDDLLAEQLKDPEFKAAYDDLEPAYQVARLRMLKGLTQAQLAEMVGTKQSSIARLESGKSQPRLSFLRRVIEALGGSIELRVYAEGEKPPAPPTAPIDIYVVDGRAISASYPAPKLRSPAKYRQERV